MCKCRILYAKHIIKYPKLNLLTRICVEFKVLVSSSNSTKEFCKFHYPYVLEIQMNENVQVL